MKQYKHKILDYLATETNSKENYKVSHPRHFTIPKWIIENSNDWELIPSIEVGKVYQSIKSLVIILIKEVVDEHDVKAIGFDGFGNWCAGYFGTTNLIETTKEDWFERCKEEAIKRGLVKGVKINSALSNRVGTIVNYYLDGDYSLNGIQLCLMDSDTGKWATVIEEKAQEYIDLHQKKYSLADLKDALNNLK